jgi:hypothetical protein
VIEKEMRVLAIRYGALISELVSILLVPGRMLPLTYFFSFPSPMISNIYGQKESRIAGLSNP